MKINQVILLVLTSFNFFHMCNAYEHTFWEQLKAIILPIIAASNTNSVNISNYQPFTEQKTSSKIYELESDKISIENNYGDITIKTDENIQTIFVKAFICAAKGHIEDIEPFNFNNNRLYATSDKKSVNASLKYLIRLPKGISVKAEAVDGSISITGCKNTQAHTTNGEIKIYGGDEATAQTTNGSIAVILNSTSATLKIAKLKTTNGNIVVNNANRVTISTTNGSVQVKFDKNGKNNGGTIRTTNGNIITKNAQIANLICITTLGSKKLH